jgi:hypothetical protein
MNSMRIVPVLVAHPRRKKQAPLNREGKGTLVLDLDTWEVEKMTKSVILIALQMWMNSRKNIEVQVRKSLPPPLDALEEEVEKG